MELRQLLKVIFRYKYIIIPMCLSAVITATLFTYVLSKRYRSSTIVLIRPQKSINFVPKREEILDFPVGYFTPIETASKTYSEIIKSPVIAEKVVNLLGLDKIKEEEGTGVRYFWKKAKKKMKDLASKTWLLLKYGQIKEEDAFSYAVKEVQKSLSVKPTKDTYLFKIQAEAKSPVLASGIANAAANVFVDYSKEMHVLEMNKAKRLSAEKIKHSEQQLDEARNALVAFKKSQGIATLKKEMELKLELLSGLESSWESANSEIRGEIARKEKIKSNLVELERFSKSASKVTDNPLIRELHSQLAKKEIKLVGLLKRYTPEHREVKAIQAEIDEIKAKLKQESPTLNSEETLSVDPVYQELLADLAHVEAELESLKAKRNSLAMAIKKKKAQIEKMPKKEADLSNLELAMQLNEETHRLLSKEYEEYVIAATREAPDIRVIHNAVTPLYPVGPIKIYYAILAGILSLIIGLGIALIMENMNMTIRSIDEAERGLALPGLMTIPQLDSVKSKSWPLIKTQRIGLPEEKRRDERAYTQFPIKVKRHKDSIIRNGVASDISLGGICCYVEGRLSLNPKDKVEISVILDKSSGKKEFVEGVVLRSKGAIAGYHFCTAAVEFVNINKALTEEIINIAQNKGSDLSSTLPPYFEESIRDLRSDLLLLRNQGMTSFLITSCGQQEGKSTIVSNLAISLFEVNKKVVLIDANLKAPSIHKIFGLTNETGLSNILSEGAPPCLKKTESGLSVLTSGPPINDLSTLLESHNMQQLLKILSNDFDFILFDSPAILASHDAALLAAMGHGVIMVLRAGKTSIEDCRRAKQILERAHAKILGVVLNSCDDKLANYYIGS
jgi:capsular exopolysaccharide synthesis family protein